MFSSLFPQSLSNAVFLELGCKTWPSKNLFCAVFSYSCVQSKEPEHENWNVLSKSRFIFPPSIWKTLWCGSRKDITGELVPASLHIPRYHFTSGQYARVHSNVSYWACKVDVMLSPRTARLLKLPISPHTHTHEHMRPFRMERLIYLKYGLWHYHTHHYDQLRNPGGKRNEKHNPRWLIIKHGFKFFFTALTMSSSRVVCSESCFSVLLDLFCSFHRLGHNITQLLPPLCWSK